MQKNCGYNLEHAYSRHPNACKRFYFLLQIAHMISQLMVKGSLLPNFVKTWGSLRNFARRLSESLRFGDITPGALSPELAAAIQIRLNSS